MNELTWMLTLKEFANGGLAEKELKEKIRQELKADPTLLVGLKRQIVRAHSYNMHSICDRSELAV